MVIKKEFGKDLSSGVDALTLSPSEVTDVQDESGILQKTHKDGWTIKGEIHEDYYRWVNNFEASHPKYGKVWGNFESIVYADSEDGFKDFFEKHKPKAWSYFNI